MEELKYQKHKRPGYYRRCELQREITKRYGVELPKWKLDYWMRLGIIPEGDAPVPGMIKDTESVRRMYSDEFAEHIFGVVFIKLKSGEIK